MAFAAYIPIGPSTKEVERAADVLDSVVCNSHDMRWAILIDDPPENGDRDVRGGVRISTSCELIVLPNPRMGIGPGHSGGLCVADLVALRYVQQNTDAAFILKLDTDSLVISPFQDRLEYAMKRLPDPGLFGVIGDSFEELRTYGDIRATKRMFEEALGFGNSFPLLTPHERSILVSWGVVSEEQFECFLKARSVLQLALVKGYSMGEYCQGGGYVVTRKMIDALARLSFLPDPLSWRDLRLGEDVMMALLCSACGLRMYDLSGHHRLFAVQPRWLALSAPDLIAMNYSIIHSIGGPREDETRRYFRERRNMMPNRGWPG